MRITLKAGVAAAALAAATALLAPQPGWAQKVLTVGGYGGSFETLMKEHIIPPFEKAHNVTVQFVPGNSTENLARLQAQKDNQEMDVVILDDGPMYQAVALGFCAPLTKVPSLPDIYDIAKMGTDKAIGIGFVATGFAYNAEMFKEKGWAPPSSWMDLADPKFDQLESIPPISNTYGLHTLVMMARLNGGSETDIDPGFKTMVDKVAPNVLVFEPSSGKMSELFQNKEIALSIWGSGRVKALADTGFPVKFAYPKEGAVALMVAACPVTHSDVPDEAQAFVDYLLQPEVQEKLAATNGFGPTNKKTVLPEALQSLPYGPDKISKLVAVDWNVINPKREEWTQRWAREVER
ncbi:putative spermidine/putrescine transport system substrate-binding protein [Tistlia consotensis]|uniref:Putative spermidine/putrescine transport system substrate-binding protein n=1 Tax=Tistlia consotensis USBA 355 TaxID=560819 RepID=A0A1Y6CV35_9PROT|nr:ABC transporter substrate-binding protein [Tistlia consotensis]SMF77050.1 putative spermidine/putrescine transport system substrate-binding protein [Tistlia consotensis USBA 355]SNS13969.1 putative spermidine/putrescine transport system substrate-binding protein [Tistlia consotensis]